ncbi:MAG: FAD-dependent oxidoreductase [Candidatus Omnitrophota bacterium]
MIYDLIIVGAGPAGITAAIYAARKKMEFILISRDIGGQTAWSGDIENYTGYQFVTGPELVAKFEEHLRKFNISLKDNETVLDIAKTGNIMRVKTDKAEYQSKTLIVASGKRSRELNVPGEKEFKNLGLSYCATCDGPLFKGKNVAVIGGGNSALDAGIQMVKIAATVNIVNISPELTGDPVMIDTLKVSRNVVIHNGSVVKRITGEKFVKAIEIDRQGELIKLDVSGIFVEIGLIPNSDFVSLVRRNDFHEVIVDAHNNTSVEGIFSAGDVTNVPEKQIIIAAGEGSKALLSAFRYLVSHKF